MITLTSLYKKVKHVLPIEQKKSADLHRLQKDKLFSIISPDFLTRAELLLLG